MTIIAPDKLAAAYHYANERGTKVSREYATAYINWLRNGAVGAEPSRGQYCPLATVKRIKREIGEMNLWEGAR